MQPNGTYRIYPDKKIMDNKTNPTENTKKMKKIFDDLLYALFGIIEPIPQNEKLDVATGGQDDLRESAIKSISKMGGKE